MRTDNRHIPVTLLPARHKPSDISNSEAMKITGPAAIKIEGACHNELFKLGDTYHTYRPIRTCDIEHDAIRIPS
jgi:hypothetical protein